MSSSVDPFDLIICIEKYVERKINKAINDYKVKPSRENCILFYNDLVKCIDTNTNTNENKNYIKGTLCNNINEPNYFDFTKCPQYKNLNKFKQIQTVKYNINEIYKPNNKFYEIRFEKGNLEINLLE